MPVAAIIAALLILGGIWIIASALSRWGRPGTSGRRVGGLVLVGAGAIFAGAAALADASRGSYAIAGIVAGVGLLMLLATRKRADERSLPRLKRRH